MSLNKNENKLRMDIVLIAGLLALSALLFFAFGTNQTEGAEVAVCVDGVEVARYSLSQEGTYPLNDGSNILVIQDKTAYLMEANCPDGLCIRQGKIKYEGQCITCLPNQLTVTVYGGENGVELVI